MRNVFFVCMMLFVYHHANAQNRITGTITDQETGESIAGATVYIPELKTGTISDTTGIYKIDNLPKIKVFLQIAFMGYKTIVKKVDLSTTNSMNFALTQAIADINEVVVGS